MPYLHLLPEPLRGRNERIDDRLPPPGRAAPGSPAAPAAPGAHDIEETRFAWESE
jgi:hypothetical protein